MVIFTSSKFNIKINFLMKFYILFILSLLFCLPISAHNKTTKPASLQQVQAINKYVDFVNESIHGMFLVNRLLVEYNLNLNKYVDLESEKINNYSNKDLPQDIFEDKDHWFYDVSPYDLLKQAKSLSTSLDPADATALDMFSSRLLTIIKACNKLRFDVDALSQSMDLTKRENLDKVYRKLEEGVKLFDDFFKVQLEMEKTLASAETKAVPQDIAIKATYDKMQQLHKATRLLLLKVRNKEVENFDQLIQNQSRAIVNYKTINAESLSTIEAIKSKLKYSLTNSITTSEEMNKQSVNFYKNDLIPAKYKLYGRFYFYYNVELIAKNNKYGSGIIFEMNNMIANANLPLVKLTEMPHIFQIIYPKKIVTEDIVKSSDPSVVALPITMKERVVTKNKVMRVDGYNVEIKLYDNMIVDGDIVSINFNGDWILENEELESHSKTVKLQLNKEGKNFLLLHADSIGKRPPNTMALSYMYNGEKKEIVLKSDLNQSELIEIIPANK
jgi:hypothetical protein